MPANRKVNAQVKSVVETAIEALKAIGLSPLSAAALLAVQGAIRISGEGADTLDAEQKLRELHALVSELLEGFETDDDGNDLSIN